MAGLERLVLRSRLPVSAEELFAWHERPGAFQRLTPPWQQVELLQRSGGLEVGACTIVRIPVGPLKRTWVAEHTAYEPGRMFRDEQRSGPFARWVHTHRTVPAGPAASLLEDELEYQLPLGGLGARVAGGRVRHQLEAAFAYRHLITRTDLERHRAFSSEPRLRIAVTGASGFLGSALIPFLTTAGHSVVRVVRRAASEDEIAWEPRGGTIDQQKLNAVDAVIHLAGANIGEGRWTEQRKAELLESRVKGTETIARAIAAMPRPPRAFVSMSGIGHYGDRGDEWLDESSSASERGFLPQITRAWEAATEPAEQRGVRTVRLRTGVVLSPNSGALQKMLTPFKLGAGGPQGSGRQWMSWIALEDLLGIFELALLGDSLRGPVNAVAPNPVTNAEFARTLGRILGRPAIAPLPEVAIAAAFGEMGRELLLWSTRAKPGALTRAGFRFLYPELEHALRMMLGKLSLSDVGAERIAGGDPEPSVA